MRQKFGVRTLLKHRGIAEAVRFPAVMSLYVRCTRLEFSSPASAKRFISGLSPAEIEEEELEEEMDQRPADTEVTRLSPAEMEEEAEIEGVV